MKMQKLIIAFCHLPKGERTPYGEIFQKGIEIEPDVILHLKKVLQNSLYKANRMDAFKVIPKFKLFGTRYYDIHHHRLCFRGK